MMMKTKPSILSISAHDPLGMSGIAMDQRALSVLGVHCASCITANTAQNQHAFYHVNAVTAEAFKSQLDALSQQDHFNVIKIGFIPNVEIAQLLTEHPIFNNKRIVFDPVLAMSSEGEILDRERLAAALYLLPHVHVLVPNLNEAKVILNHLDVNINECKSPLVMAQALHHKGVAHVLLKGGHGDQLAEDVYVSNERYFYLNHKTFEHKFNRGTGCAMASLIAGACAKQYTVADSVVIAKMIMCSGWQTPYKLDDSTGGFDFDRLAGFSAVFDQTKGCTYQLPQLYTQHQHTQLSFLPCESSLGLYPIVDRASWLARLLPLGIKVVQLRIKDLTGQDLKTEIQQSIRLAEQYNCQLFINDYWQLAIECGAFGVHLGQEDIDDADLHAISEAGLRLGLSSHCFYEVARAKTIQPSYIAFGPVYATQTKDMPWIPQGANGLAVWRKLIDGFPIVAIGGIHGERFEQVKQMGVDSIAMVSAITQADNPEQECSDYMARWMK